MNRTPTTRSARDIATLLARWILGGLFIYMGLNKALHPVDFLKLLHQYELTNNYWLLNALAGALPWFEVFCGLLLVAGIAVRGSALLLLVLLGAFSWIVLQRALAIQVAQQIPFAMVKFDCGCGAGEVFIWRKLLENLGLLTLSIWLVCSRSKTDCVQAIQNKV
jgi:uncharacterized membrane protein YphA (DoxX/SURF4 family)